MGARVSDGGMLTYAKHPVQQKRGNEVIDGLIPRSQTMGTPIRSCMLTEGLRELHQGDPMR